MAVQIIHASQDGSLIIPKEITGGLRISPNDDFLLVGDKERILLKRVIKPDVKMLASQVMDKISHMFESHNITEDDVAREINTVRKGKCSPK